MTNNRKGWMKDFPDHRDYHDEVDEIQELAIKSPGIRSKTNPRVADLRSGFSPIEQQGSIGSCVANAAVSLLEFYERRAFGSHIEGSRLFTYKTTRRLLGWEGDTGAYLRTGMQSLAMFGVPPERYWPYTTEEGKWDREPDAAIYAMAQSFQGLKYYRLDTPHRTPEQVLKYVKRFTAAGLPTMFGFVVHSNLPNELHNPNIPFPKSSDRATGGHAICCVGYDDDIVIEGRKGALIIRNSWGLEWGEEGYGFLPYDYILAGLATDFWALLRAEYLNTRVFD